jgi:hypothetical protein
VRLSNITALVPPFLHPELNRNQQETVRCIKERSGTKDVYDIHLVTLSLQITLWFRQLVVEAILVLILVVE